MPDNTFIQLTAETAVQVSDLAVDERLKVLMDKPKGEKVSVSLYAQAGPNYGEVYAGPTLHLKNLALNASLGLETADMPLRGAASAFWANDQFAAFAVIEYGGTGLWYKAFAKATFKHASIGVMAQRYDGLGPQLSVKSHGLELWTSPMYDYEVGTFNIVTGLNWIP